MEPVTSLALKTFLQRLGERYTNPAELYLLGGSALCLLGNPRETLDVDYTFDLIPELAQNFRAIIEQLGTDMKLDLESVPLGEFIPLPPEAHQRRRFVGNCDISIRISSWVEITAPE